MVEEENRFQRYEVVDGLIVDGLIVDKSKRCVTTPNAKNVPEALGDLAIVNELYDEWHSYPTGTVIRHECCEAAKLVTTQRKSYRRPDEDTRKKFSLDERFVENSNLFFAVKPSKTAKEGYCVLFRYPDSKQIYLLAEVPRICRPISFAYRETDGINSGYESTTALTTFYKINGFSGWFKKQTFPPLSEEYRVEMKMFMYYLFYHYNSRQHLLTLDVADTGTKRTESSMGNHQLETIDSYMPFLYRLYFYLLHADMFNDAELNETIVQKLQYFKENIGDCYGSKGEMLQDKLKVKLRMFRDLIVLMLSDECMFSFPVKATCLKTDGSMQDTEYCLKTMNAYKAFLKYVLIFSETNTLSEEFRRAWCGEGSFQTIENLKMVYSSVYAKRENCTPTQTRVLADGAVMVNGFRFCPDLVSRLYGKLLKTYEECLDGLRAYTGIISVQDCYKRLRGTYCYQKECSFYSCFPEELTRALIENVDSTCFEGVAYKNTLHLFDELCSAIVALVLLSSGSTLRLQEYTKLTQCSPQTLFLHQGRDGEYCYFSTDINKNHSLKRRTMFVNLEVSRYLIHYCCVIKPLLHTITRQAPLDKTLFSLEEKMKDFQAEQDLIDSVTSTEVMRQISTTQFMRTYIFVSSINKGDDVYISKVVSTRVTKLLTKLGGKGCGAASVRQAFCLYNEEIHKELGFAVTKKVNEMLNQNAGHTELTALRHYAFDSESLQDKRGATFEMCLDATLRLNRMLKMIQEVEAKPEGATDSVSARHSELVFGHQELVEAKQELFPDMVYREHQEAEIHAIGAAAHTYVLQAPTGFGKTILFSTLLKAVNRKDRSLVNLVLVPYSPLLADMTNRLKELGFNVGSASNLSLVWESGAKCDVYIGIYDQLVGSGLHILRENLGLVVFDEAHCLTGDCSFRDCLKDYYRFNFSGFKKLLFLSATLTKRMAEKTLDMLKITDGMLYSNMILRHPNVGNIYVTSIDPEMAKKSSYDLVQETLGKFLDKFADGKAIVFYCDKSKLRRDSAAFKQCLTINGDMDTAEKRRVINQFVSSKSDRVLMGTKLISNGINVTDVRLVIFAGYDPEAVDFIQGLGRIRKKGLCVVVSSNGFCGADVIGEFYGIYDGEHHWCCGVPDDSELQELFHCVIGDKHRVPVQSGGGDIEFAEVSTPTHEIPSQEVSLRRARIPEIGTAAAEVATPVLRNDWNPSWIPENSIVIDLDDEDGIGNEGANQTDYRNVSFDALSKSMDDTADNLFSNSANMSASTDCTGEMADTADSPVTGLSQFALRDLLGGFHIQKGGSAMPKSTKSRTIEKKPVEQSHTPNARKGIMACPPSKKETLCDLLKRKSSDDGLLESSKKQCGTYLRREVQWLHEDMKKVIVKRDFYQVYSLYDEELVPAIYREFSRRVHNDPFYMICFAEITALLGLTKGIICPRCLVTLRECRGCQDNTFLRFQAIFVLNITGVLAPNEIRALGHGVRPADMLIEKAMRQFNLFETISEKLSSVFVKRNNFDENERWMNRLQEMKDALAQRTFSGVVSTLCGKQVLETYPKDFFFRMIRAARVSVCEYCFSKHERGRCGFFDCAQLALFLTWQKVYTYEITVPEMYADPFRCPMFSLYYNLCLLTGPGGKLLIHEE